MVVVKQLTRQPLSNGAQTGFKWPPLAYVRIVKDHARSLEHASRGFRYCEPDRVNRITHEHTSDEIYRGCPDGRKDVIFERRKPGVAMALICPAASKSFMAGASRLGKGWH